VFGFSPVFVCLFLARHPPQWAKASSFTKFLDHTQRRTTVGRTPRDECSACRRNLYLTTHNSHNRQTSMPPGGIRTQISADERPQTYALDRAITEIGILSSCLKILEKAVLILLIVVQSSWNVMAHGDAREGKWRGNWRMAWVASTLHTTSEHGVSSITTADAHTSAVSSRLNWRPCPFKRTRPFRRKRKSGFCACAITFQLASADITLIGGLMCLFWRDQKETPIEREIRLAREREEELRREKGLPPVSQPLPAAAKEVTCLCAFGL
jgi:hypothetical protein